MLLGIKIKPRACWEEGTGVSGRPLKGHSRLNKSSLQAPSIHTALPCSQVDKTEPAS